MIGRNCMCGRWVPYLARACYSCGMPYGKLLTVRLATPHTDIETGELIWVRCRVCDPIRFPAEGSLCDICDSPVPHGESCAQVLARSASKLASTS